MTGAPQPRPAPPPPRLHRSQKNTVRQIKLKLSQESGSGARGIAEPKRSFETRRESPFDREISRPSPIFLVMDRTGSMPPPAEDRRVDTDPSVSPTHGEQEKSSWNGQLPVDLRRSAVPVQRVRRYGNAAPGPAMSSADDWEKRAEAVGCPRRSAERIKDAIRLRAAAAARGSAIFSTRPVGRLLNEVRCSYGRDTYQAGSGRSSLGFVAKVAAASGRATARPALSSRKWRDAEERRRLELERVLDFPILKGIPESARA